MDIAIISSNKMDYESSHSLEMNTLIEKWTMQLIHIDTELSKLCHQVLLSVTGGTNTSISPML